MRTLCAEPCFSVQPAETYLYSCLVDFFTRCSRYIKWVDFPQRPFLTAPVLFSPLSSELMEVKRIIFSSLKPLTLPRCGGLMAPLCVCFGRWTLMLPLNAVKPTSPWFLFILFQPPERFPTWWLADVLQKHVPGRSRRHGFHSWYGKLPDWSVSVGSQEGLLCLDLSFTNLCHAGNPKRPNP